MIFHLITDALKDSEKNKKISIQVRGGGMRMFCIEKQMTRKNIAPHTRVKRVLVRVDGVVLGTTC